MKRLKRFEQQEHKFPVDHTSKRFFHEVNETLYRIILVLNLRR